MLSRNFQKKKKPRFNPIRVLTVNFVRVEKQNLVFTRLPLVLSLKALPREGHLQFHHRSSDLVSKKDRSAS